MTGAPPSSEHAAVKWIAFARQVFALMLVSVVTVAGLSAVASTKQAQALLRESLAAQGRAIADAAAAAAFVPLSLEDRAMLAGQLEPVRAVENVAYVRVRDAAGRTLHEVARGGSGRAAVAVRSAVAPKAGSGTPGAPIGEVEVGMWSDRIEAKCRQIAWVNVLVSGALASSISLAGYFLLRTLVARMHELVGEARLVEEVKRANAELESFSYSVSHDLRAPLRGIAGFSQIVLEDSAASLDDAGKENLRRVVASTKLMGGLIDDMLELSRVSRTELRRAKVDLSALAAGVVEELRQRDPGRRAEVAVAPGLVAEGDAPLLRIALTNLLGNAWKYTSKRPDARIEFGASREAGGGPVFFVKDNGAGFDMAYAGKLFGAFQRLHAQSEFEGTGVGLATVQRIVRRHGGSVWAEAAVEKGAAFYFTL